MSGHETSKEKPIFSFAYPHFHNEWCCELVVRALKQRGYHSLTPHYDISNPDMTRDDHADTMWEAEQKMGAENYVRVGSSYGADLIYRRLDEVPVSKIVPFSAPLRPVIKRLGIPISFPALANNPAVGYQAVVRAMESDWTKFDREALAQELYQGIGDIAIKAWATEHIEPHPHEPENGNGGDENAVLPVNIDTYFIGTINDLILPYRNQRLTAQYLNLDFLPFPSGHFAMFEKPDLQAELLVQIASGNIKRAQWWELAKQERLKKLKKNSN